MKGAMICLALFVAFSTVANARPMSGNPPPKQMAVPCYLRIYNGFCFTSSDKGACTFYSAPSYATFKECSEDKNMGTYVKCADVKSDLRTQFNDNYKTCVDKEVLRGGSGSSGGGSAQVSWNMFDNKDVAGKDIASGGKSFTEVCDSIEKVQERCVKTSGCSGFTFNGKCGYLKSSTGETKERGGWAVFAIRK